MSKVVVISGASSGIGLACADIFAQKGYKVYCLSTKCPDNYPYKFIKCDVTKQDDIIDAYNVIISQEENIDILICNAGKGISGPLENCELNQAKDLFDVNFFGAFNLAQTFMPKFKTQHYGKILFMSSVGSIFPLPFQAFYSASKSALETMANAWRIEVAPFGIQIGCILPGDTKTNFTQSRQKTSGDDSYGVRVDSSIKKMEKDEQKGMTPQKVAKVVYKVCKKRKLPIKSIVGCQYKFFSFLSKILPQRLVLWFVAKIYG